MAVSNRITSILNITSMLSSFPIIISGIWVASKPDNECIHWLRFPILFFGISIFIISLIGFIGAHKNKQGLIAIYLIFMAFIISALILLLVLAFIVTRPSGAYVVPNRGYKEYKLDGYSSWMRKIVDSENWLKIRVCLADSEFCPDLNQMYIGADQFLIAPISPIQSGCCKPPTSCGYQFVNPTMWISPFNMGGDPDCSVWSNDQRQLCYNCESCKAGLLGNLRYEWRKVNVAIMVAVVVLIFVYMIGCIAFKNSQNEDLFRNRKRGWA
ncbi:tetraspanin-2-like [Impatiens glandulifera]|uniref:tetraspanin-2-like n=1 Tax=Impatiens glandulifera TaxID=253017 RepID=UPI001FB0CC52|nr:tetraspanin-2-like [Impatiens glandulifera]